MNYNEIKELSVLSLYEGELLGKVDKVFFDKKLKKLMELELVGEDGARLILQTKNIYNIGKNAITVKNNDAVQLKNETSENVCFPIGCKVFSINGEFLGVSQDIAINSKFLVEKLVLNNDTTLDINRLASCGKNAIIFFTGEEKINVKNFVPAKTIKKLKAEESQIVETMPVEEKSVEAIEIKENVLMQNTDFLLGRVCVKDILNFNNEVLIKAHGIVNKKNLKEINKYGKLRELMLYLK